MTAARGQVGVVRLPDPRQVTMTTSTDITTALGARLRDEPIGPANPRGRHTGGGLAVGKQARPCARV